MVAIGTPSFYKHAVCVSCGAALIATCEPGCTSVFTVMLNVENNPYILTDSGIIY